MRWNLAAAQGLVAAQRGRDAIQQRMTREQIAEAQRLSREWIETHPQDAGNREAVIATSWPVRGPRSLEQIRDSLIKDL